MAYTPPLNGGRINATISGNTAGAGSLVSTGTLTLAGGNNITLSQNGNAITISGANGGGTMGMYGLGNTTQNSSTTVDVRSVSLNGLGAMTVGYSNGSVQLSAPVVSSVSATGALSISANGSTVSMGVPAVSFGMSNIGNTSGTSGTASNQLILAGGNNVTLSQSTGAGGNTITISAGNNGSLSMYGLGNTIQNSSTVLDVRSVSLNGIGAMSVGYSNGSVQLSAPQTSSLSATGAITLSTNGSTISIGAPVASSLSATGALSISSNGNTISIGAPAFSAGISSNSTVSNQLILAGGNNVTLSQSTNASGATISISGPNALTTARASTDAIGLNTAKTNVTWTVNSSGLSLNAAGYAGTGFSGTNASATLNSNGLQLSVGAGGAAGSNTFGMSNLGNTSGTTGVVSGSAAQLILAGGNNVTLSQSINGSSATVTVSGASFANANNVSLGINAGTVTASASFSQTVQTQNLIAGLYDGAASITSGMVSFADANGVSFGINGQTITGSHNGITSQSNQDISLYALGNTTQNSSTLLNASNLSFNGLGNVTVGYSGGSIQISGNGGGGGGVAIYDGLLSASSGTVYLSDANNISFGLSTAATGQTLTGSVPAVSSLVGTGGVSLSTAGNVISISGPGATFSNWEPQIAGHAQMGLSAVTNSALNIYKIQAPGFINASRLDQFIFLSYNSTTASSGAGSISMYAGLYGSTGSSVSLLSSGSQSYAYTISSTNNSLNYGWRALSLPMNVSASPGQYWVGLLWRTSAAGLAHTVSNVVFSNFANTVSFGGLLGQAANATQGLQEGVGSYSSNTSGMPTVVPMSSIIQSLGSRYNVPWLGFKNITW